jgi:hypothetical protein
MKASAMSKPLWRVAAHRGCRRMTAIEMMLKTANNPKTQSIDPKRS